MAMNSIGEFVLIIGDIHIPQRASSIPEPFKELLMPGKMQHVICPGNVGSREVSRTPPNYIFLSTSEAFKLIKSFLYYNYRLSSGLRIWLPQKVKLTLSKVTATSSQVCQRLKSSRSTTLRLASSTVIK